MTAPDPLADILSSLARLEPGHVWLAGAGPGGPGTLTLDTLAGLRQADVVVHDALVDRAVLDLAGPGAVLEFAGKRGGRPSAQQADISARLVALAREGRRVLRLKGGDPFVFGRGGEEMLTLAAAGIPFRVLPGVTAGLAALAVAYIPATMRGVNQAVVLATGYSAEEGEEAARWAALARSGQPLVIYMAMSRLGGIADSLIAAGLPPETPAAVVASATAPGQRVIVAPLAGIDQEAREAGIEPPAILVVGGIVPLRAEVLRLIEAHGGATA
jgi:uroporphyrin-III C-methyltransferase